MIIILGAWGPGRKPKGFHAKHRFKATLRIQTLLSERDFAVIEASWARCSRRGHLSNIPIERDAGAIAASQSHVSGWGAGRRHTASALLPGGIRRYFHLVDEDCQDSRDRRICSQWSIVFPFLIRKYRDEDSICSAALEAGLDFRAEADREPHLASPVAAAPLAIHSSKNAISPGLV